MSLCFVRAVEDCDPVTLTDLSRDERVANHFLQSIGPRFMRHMAHGFAVVFHDMSDRLILGRKVRVEDDAELVAFNPVRFQLPQRTYADHVVGHI